MDPQRMRAIRRAVESAASIKRPADWTEADYRRFDRTLDENGYVLVEKPEDGENDSDG